MSLYIEKVAKSQIQRDYIYPVENVSAIIIHGKMYFFGGHIENNVSQSIFYYDIISRDVVKLPETPLHKNVLCILKEPNTVSFIDESNDLYKLEDGMWKFIDTYDLGDNIKTVITEDSQYVITKQKIYEYKDRAFTLVYEHDSIDSESYIPSPDKGIIYFKNGIIDLSNKTVFDNSFNADYIVYGQAKLLDINSPIVIDKKNSYVYTYNSPISEVKKKTFSSTNWITDKLNSKEKKFNTVVDILINDDKFYFSEVQGTTHNVHRVDLNSGTINLEQSMHRKNSSYSKNIQYNHSIPKFIKYKDTIAFMGNGGYYNDNGLYDNSLYVNKKLEHVFDLDIKNPVYYSNNNIISILDSEKSLMRNYSLSGELVEEYPVPTINNIVEMCVYNDVVIIRSEQLSCVVDKTTDKIKKVVRHEQCLDAALNENYVYTIQEVESNITLNRVSLNTDNKKSYSLPNINDYKIIKLYANNGYILLYIEKENYNWEIYRIIIDE